MYLLLHTKLPVYSFRVIDGRLRSGTAFPQVRLGAVKLIRHTEPIDDDLKVLLALRSDFLVPPDPRTLVIFGAVADSRSEERRKTLNIRTHAHLAPRARSREHGIIPSPINLNR